MYSVASIARPDGKVVPSALTWVLAWTINVARRDPALIRDGLDRPSRRDVDRDRLIRTLNPDIGHDDILLPRHLDLPANGR